MRNISTTALAVLLITFPLSASLINEDPEQAVAQIETIVQKKQTQKPVVNELIEALQSPESNIRVKERAAWALGELEVASAGPVLIEACQNKGLLVRSAALNALLQIRPSAALPTVTEIAESDPILSLRQNATLGMGLLQSDKAIKSLVKLSSDPTPEVRGASALAMASLQSKKNDFSEIIKEIEADENPYVQDRGKKAMDVVQGKNKSVQEHLNSQDVDIRLFAALYFYHHGTSSDLKVLKAAENGETDEATRIQLEKSIKAIKKRATHTKKKTTSKSQKKK